MTVLEILKQKNEQDLMDKLKNTADKLEKSQVRQYKLRVDYKDRLEIKNKIWNDKV